MSEMIAVLIFVFATVTVIGLFLVSIPVTRRLGRVLEEWLIMRQEGAPEDLRGPPGIHRIARRITRYRIEGTPSHQLRAVKQVAKVASS